MSNASLCQTLINLTLFFLQDNSELSVGEEDEEIFLNEGQQFRVNAARTDAAGRYTCIAENKAGRVEKDIIVDILCKMATTANRRKKLLKEAPASFQRHQQSKMQKLSSKLPKMTRQRWIACQIHHQLKSHGRKMELRWIAIETFR